MTAPVIGNWSIRARVVFLALVPLLISTAIVGYAAISARIKDVNDGLQERGRALAKHLAVASEFGLFSGNSDQLRSLAQAALQEPDVQAISILGADRQPLVEISEGDLHPELSLIFEEIVAGSGVAAFDFSERSSASESRVERLGAVRVMMSRRSSIDRAREVVVATVLAAVGGALLSMLLALWVGRSVMNPVRRLTGMVQRLGSGNLAERVPSDSGGELGVLERGFNAMAESMESAQLTLQVKVEEATAQWKETVATLEQRNRELDAARDQALQAGQAKADFLARMSHEIRTPINAVIGFAQLLAKVPDATQQHEYAQTINQAASQLLSVVDDILQFSRIESGALQLERIPFDLRDSLEEVVCMLRPGAHAKHLELVLTLGADVPVRLVGDPTRFGQVLVNLVNNALKFTNAGSITIRVSLERIEAVHAHLRVVVTDTGIGIGADQQQYLFSAFSQADTSVSRRYGGTGLGLAIAKRLVNLMEGDIGVDSTEGNGASFRFTSKWELQSQPAPPAAQKPLAGHKVLLVEEHAIARRAMRNQLIDWQMEVFTAAEVGRLQTLLHSAGADGTPFDVVVISIPAALHEYTSVFAEVSAARDFYSGPVLLLLSSESCELPAALRADRGIRCLAKPSRVRTLHAALADLLGIRNVGTTDEPPVENASEFVGLRVLLAEDNDFNRTLITTWLEAKGVVVDAALDGAAAVQRALAQQYDVILMDIHMPVMDGREATRQIRVADGLSSRVPIIALTADVFATERGALLQGGIDDCVFKPVREEILWNAIARATGRASRVTESMPVPTRRPAPEPNASSIFVPDVLREKLPAELPTHRDALRAAFSAGDLEAAREAAHRLCGVAGYFGIGTLSFTANQLERALRQSGLAGAGTLLEALEQEFNAVLKSATGPDRPVRE